MVLHEGSSNIVTSVTTTARVMISVIAIFIRCAIATKRQDVRVAEPLIKKADVIRSIKIMKYT